MTTPKLLTPDEAAKLLRVSPSFLSNARCTGRYRIPHIKIGKAVRYREADLLAWMESRLHHSGEAA